VSAHSSTRARVTVVTVTSGCVRDMIQAYRAFAMKKLKFILSLTNNDNDYQIEQAAAAEQSAKRLGAEVQIIHAENDSVTQSQQLLKIIQSRSDSLPDGIIFEPVGGTALPQVARAAAMAGIAWVVLNRDAEYIPELRKAYRVPAFCITSDHEEIGRIQGRQLAAILPYGGAVLYIQGPSDSLAAKQRTFGMYETKPAEINVKLMKAQWTEASAHRTVSSWLRLSTSQQTHLDLVAAQDDSMAMGARKAFEEEPNLPARERWLKLPYIGCDGLPNTGQVWVRRGLLTATIFVPPNAGKAVELLMESIQNGSLPAERSLIAPVSIPSLDVLTAFHGDKARGLSAGR
jgi:ribose transport system substrate-binding protein